MNDDSIWKRFYTSRGGLCVEGTEAPLIDICPDSPTCWSRIPSQQRSRFSVSHPYVGSRYKEGRILVYGQNLNLGPDDLPDMWLGLAKYVETVSQHQRDGWKRKTGLGGGKYFTPFWHFLISYATVIANRIGVTDVDDPYENIVAASATWDILAFSEVVKCQPFRGNGKPSAEMLQKCPRRFACEEPAQLQPIPLAGLVVGIDAARALADAHGARVVEGAPFVSWLAEKTSYFGVPHPARPGFSRTELIGMFATFANSMLPGRQS